MNASRLGCITFPGLLAAGATLLIVTIITLLRGGVLFNPGALNAQAGEPLGGYLSHAAFGNQCGLCHAPFWEAGGMSERCQACHTSIAAERSDPNTLHGAIYQQSPTLACRKCHPEHRGANAPLTEFTNGQFPHDQLGFSLQGHRFHPNRQPFTCRDCHTPGFPPFDPMICQTCHRQIDVTFTEVHILDFGTQCLACHDGIDTYGDDFDHGRYFPLTGQHAGKPCSACHQNARARTDLQATPTTCYACHASQDIHEGRLGSDCSACHTPEGWRPAQFDHNLAAFPLTGKHVLVACESCHINRVFQGTPTDCYSCHAQDDAHRGEYGTDCAACHTPEDWKKVSFDHARTRFPLTGAHIGLPCTRCHVNNVFKGLSASCSACHQEPPYHAGLFRNQSCDACHTTVAWRPALFNQPHAIPINHGGGATCQTCHPNTLTAYTCYGCHEHNPAKIREEHIKEGITTFTDCISCHPSGQKKEGENDD
ncbi:MAG: hypothetical protein NZL98_11330 [Anaerolineales bacterium]|nr:hypothetical protein [Anaerolineales bacterium]